MKANEMFQKALDVPIRKENLRRALREHYETNNILQELSSTKELYPVYFFSVMFKYRYSYYIYLYRIGVYLPLCFPFFYTILRIMNFVIHTHIKYLNSIMWTRRQDKIRKKVDLTKLYPEHI